MNYIVLFSNLEKCHFFFFKWLSIFHKLFFSSMSCFHFLYRTFWNTKTKKKRKEHQTTLNIYAKTQVNFIAFSHKTISPWTIFISLSVSLYSTHRLDVMRIVCEYYEYNKCYVYECYKWANVRMNVNVHACIHIAFILNVKIGHLFS